MKTPAASFDTAHAPSRRAPIVGRFPPRMDSIRAEVLARLLSGERMTSMDGVFGAGTTRLAAQVHVLRHEYAWPIDGEDIDVECRDGHVASVTRYSLVPQVTAAALAAGAGDWLAVVFILRKAKRDNAPRAGRRAA